MDPEEGGRVKGTLRKGAGSRGRAGRGEANDGNIAENNDREARLVCMWQMQKHL